ncbi:MAG: SIP domain-containing protein, partial [Altererythrobacter sp.]|nr:SIP domain-containing protein [Altererythrobacter sp.]
NPSPGTQTALLSSALRAHELPRGTIAGWAACEFSAMRELRTLLRDEMGLGSSSLYISSYWKLGINEAEHKQVKSDDTKAQQG